MSRHPRDENDQGPLNLEWINFCFPKNGQKHRTDKYYCMRDTEPTLVVRRGIPICYYLKFDREFDIKTDNVSFVFKLAGKNHTLVQINALYSFDIKEFKFLFYLYQRK